MRRCWLMCCGVLVAAALAFPAFAVDFKYGGMYFMRWQSQNNLTDGNDDFDDNANWFDQRVHMYFTFVGSEKLQLVTKWEADTQWGLETPGAGRHGGGDIGADATNLEMKNVYLEFMVPGLEATATVGVQGADILGGWIFSDDFSGAVLTKSFDPLNVRVGYVAGQNQNVTDVSENIDDFFLELSYAQGPFSATVVGFYQSANNNKTSIFEDYNYDQPVDWLSGRDVRGNDLIDLGLYLAYTNDWIDAHVNFVKNLGGYDIVGGGSGDYKGWMLEARADVTVSSFVLSAGGFYTTGDDDLNDNDVKAFVYPIGRSFYWSEILGLGTLDVNAGGFDTYNSVGQGAYVPGDGPSNLWMLTAGVKWQAMEETALTVNYYYIGTSEKVESAPGETDDSIGHEINVYVDQGIVDGLSLQLVGAYMFADDAFKTIKGDDDVYEVGAMLEWRF
ncbi:MAG: hypothetical protein ACUVWY_09845 [Desulfosoma sp.]|uniref:hypothetical protein n=1 Tax=Desulfosoma sp. TaxID=2603217 RepID=UPI00404B08A2